MADNANNVDMARLELLLREHFARTDKQIAEMRAENAEFRSQIKDDMQNFREEIRSDMENFKSEVRSEINSFKSEVNAKIDGLRSEMNSRFDNVQTQIHVMQLDITGLKHDVANLYRWNYWMVAIIIGVFLLPTFADFIRGLFEIVRDGIAGILALFKREK
ncbi:MAG: DUF1640 domain-containing protein [Synergistaceae bacterium]|nr:DUF1640 domain-containing protein [Synergistaceae bacterium]